MQEATLLRRPHDTLEKTRPWRRESGPRSRGAVPGQRGCSERRWRGRRGPKRVQGCPLSQAVARRREPWNPGERDTCLPTAPKTPLSAFLNGTNRKNKTGQDRCSLSKQRDQANRHLEPCLAEDISFRDRWDVAQPAATWATEKSPRRVQG